MHVPELPIQLRRPLGCDSYNHFFFDDQLPALATDSADSPAPLQDFNPPPKPPEPTTDTDITPDHHSPIEIDSDLVSCESDPSTLHESILSSTDKLFFIAYRFQTALRPRFAAVQVDLDHKPSTPGSYYCHFLCQPSSDKDLPEQSRRWWPIWHRYRTAPDGVIEYLERVEFKPSTIPDSSKYIAWADTIPLNDPSHALLGPFDFLNPNEATDRSRTPSFRQFIDPQHWARLRNICLARGILPPALTIIPKRTQSSHQAKKRRRSQR
jgi:hypothetical protein